MCIGDVCFCGPVSVSWFICTPSARVVGLPNGCLLIPYINAYRWSRTTQQSCLAALWLTGTHLNGFKRCGLSSCLQIYYLTHLLVTSNRMHSNSAKSKTRCSEWLTALMMNREAPRRRTERDSNRRSKYYARWTRAILHLHLCQIKFLFQTQQ